MWELVELDRITFGFKLVGTFQTMEEGIEARTDTENQFLLYSGLLNFTSGELRQLIARIDSIHHNEIRLILKSSHRISGQFACIYSGYDGPEGHVNCYYWSDKKLNYGWVVDGGKC